MASNLKHVQLGLEIMEGVEQYTQSDGKEGIRLQYTIENPLFEKKEIRSCCYVFIHQLLHKTNPLALEELIDFMERKDKKGEVLRSFDGRPCPFHYHYAFGAHTKYQFKFWQSVKDFQQTRQGDIISYQDVNFKLQPVSGRPRAHGMHLMLALGAPEKVAGRLWKIPILECSDFIKRKAGRQICLQKTWLFLKPRVFDAGHFAVKVANHRLKKPQKAAHLVSHGRKCKLRNAEKTSLQNMVSKRQRRKLINHRKRWGFGGYLVKKMAFAALLAPETQPENTLRLSSNIPFIKQTH